MLLRDFPVAVSGRASTKTTASGSHHLATRLARWSITSATLACAPSRKTTTSRPLVPARMGRPMGRLRERGMADRGVFQFDRTDPFPPDLITSLVRSVICKVPSGWRIATSPVSNQPCAFTASCSAR
jgi:hypothetical protein